MLNKICDKIAFSGVLFLLVFAPLAFGSVHVWAYSMVEIIVFSISGIFILGRICRSGAGEVAWVKTPVNWLLGALVLLIAVQLTPMPMSWIKTISPKTAELKAQAGEIIHALGAANPKSEIRNPKQIINSNLKNNKQSSTDTETPSLSSVPGTPGTSHPSRSFPFSRLSRLSFNPHGSLRELLKLLAYIAMFFLVVNLVDSKNRMDIIVLTLIGVGLFEALYGIYQGYSMDPRVWWWKSRAGGGRFASGTFIGSNHFAGYMEMTLFLTWGYILSLRKKTMRMKTGMGGARAGFQRFLGGFSPESVQPKKVLLFFVAAVMGLALLRSASRAGILSVFVAMLIMTGMMFFRKRRVKAGLLAFLFSLGVLAAGLFLGLDPTLEKFERVQSLSQRFELAEPVIPMICDYPAVGVGWGNNPDLYPQYATNSRPFAYYNGYVHNDWLEAISEVGLPGLFLMAALWVVFFSRMVRVWKRRRNAYAMGIAAGAMAAMIALSIHSFWDLNMHIPANPLTLAAILGLGFVVLHHKGVGHGLKFIYSRREIRVRAWAKPVFGAATIAATAALISPATAHLRAEIQCPTELNTTLNLNWSPDRERIQAAIQRNPRNADYYYRMALLDWSALTRSSDTADGGPPGDPDQAFADLLNSVRHNPARAAYWHLLARFCENRKEDLYRYLTRMIPLADQCHEMAVSRAPRDPQILVGTAWYWVWRSSLLPTETNSDPAFDASRIDPLKPPETREQAIKRFQGLFREYLAARPGKWKRCVDRVAVYYNDDGIIMGILPEDNLKIKKAAIRHLAAFNKTPDNRVARESPSS